MEVYGLLGKSLKHSFSKKYFEEKFRSNKIDCRYENFELESASELHALLKSEPNLKGLNVTIPYKTAIMAHLDEISPEAKEIGAVNTIKIVNGKTIGHNTDWIGFRDSIKPFLALGMEKALVLGTGGASKAVEYALKPLGIEVLYVSRTATGSNCFSYQDINSNAIGFIKLIVNTTPIGMFPEIVDCPNIPYEAITPQHLLYDLIYNPAETEFLKKGKEQGAITVNGHSMLKIQAERSWEIWNKE